LKSSRFVVGKFVLALLAVASVVASSIFAAEAATVNGPPKPPLHASPHTISSPAHHPAVKKAATSPTTAHSTYRPTTVSAKPGVAHTGAPHYASGKPPMPAASAYTARRTQPHSSAYAVQHKALPARSRYARPAPVRTLNGYQRLARLHLQPERVQEIQQALIREGYLHGDPNGLWDSQTHDAMLRYQADHGFPATGLPEAKSLMKLGLGSHPLPPELDHSPLGVPTPGAAQGDLAAPVASPPVSQITPPS
jgi:hypothetical protein